MFGSEQKRGKPMIGRDYFRRQATTLRKMVSVTKNPSIADRLSLMAEDFETRSANEPGEAAPEAAPRRGDANREGGRN